MRSTVPILREPMVLQSRQVKNELLVSIQSAMIERWTTAPWKCGEEWENGRYQGEMLKLHFERPPEIPIEGTCAKAKDEGKL